MKGSKLVVSPALRDYRCKLIQMYTKRKTYNSCDVAFRVHYCEHLP
jgi:hypothetical protein